jgi:hypothetical protein
MDSLADHFATEIEAARNHENSISTKPVLLIINIIINRVPIRANEKNKISTKTTWNREKLARSGNDI